MKKLCLCAMVLVALAWAGKVAGDQIITGLLDLQGTMLIPRGASVPGTCTQGQLFFHTAAAAGSNLMGCTAGNTWTAQGASSGAAAYEFVRECFRDATLNRGCPFGGNGTVEPWITAGAGPGSAATEVTVMSTAATAGEKVSFYFRLPITPTQWKATLNFYSAGTSQVDVTWKRSCTSVGSAISFTYTNSTVVSITPAAANRFHTATADIAAGCSAGQWVSLVAETNAVTVRVLGFNTNIQ